jgi:acetyl-CoA acetyltransferase
MLVGEGAMKTTGRLSVDIAAGLLANGEPIGAFGMCRVWELVTRLHDRAGNRQVAGASSGYGQLCAATGTAVVTIVCT